MNEFWNANGNLILALLAELIGGIILWLRTGKTTKEEKQERKIEKSKAKTEKLLKKAENQAHKTEKMQGVNK